MAGQVRCCWSGFAGKYAHTVGQADAQLRRSGECRGQSYFEKRQCAEACLRDCTCRSAGKPLKAGSIMAT